MTQTNKKVKNLKVAPSKKLQEISFSGKMKTLVDKRLDKVLDAQDKRRRTGKK